MVTEIILVIFAILYYLFSVFLSVTTIDTDEINNFGLFLRIFVLSPIATPIMLGIEIGEWIKNN